jgi:hypothetical protein
VDLGGNVILDNSRLAALPLPQAPSDQTSLDAAPRVKLTGQSRMNTRTLALVIQRMARE